jgi:5-methyltetrahydrofolate--homocysteine methyltransferase
MIGERINPTGRKLLAEEMKAGDFSRVERDAVAQVEAGAHMLDVNAGIPLADEPAILARTIQLVQSLVDVPLSIDSSIVEALEAGLAVYQGKALVNSVTGEEERLERVLPLIRKYGAAVVAISNDDTGISEDPDVRFEVARRIVERAADHGIPREDVIVDPLVMPIGAMATAGQQVFRLVRRLREELGVNTTCGASNVSFGMPDRERINAAFLPMAIASGLTSAITNPLAAEVKAAIMAANVLMGNDQDAARWIRAHRDAAQLAPAAVHAGATNAGAPGRPRAVVGAAAGDPRPAGGRPRINRRALAAASAMRDAGSTAASAGRASRPSENGAAGRNGTAA